MYENFPKHEAERINKYTLWLLCDNAKISRYVISVENEMKTKWRMRSCVSNRWNVIYVLWCSLWYSPPRLFDIFSFHSTIQIWKNSCRRVFTFSICHTANAIRGIRTSRARTHMYDEWRKSGKHLDTLSSRTKTSCYTARRYTRTIESVSLSKYDTVYVESHSLFFFRIFGFSRKHSTLWLR